MIIIIPSLFVLIYYLQSVFTCYTMGKCDDVWLAGRGKSPIGGTPGDNNTYE